MIHYEVSSSEKVQNLEKALEKELKELKDEIEETDMLYGNWSKPISSVLMPKTASYYKEERKITISKILDVSDAPQLKSQGSVMMKELDASLKSDFSDQGFPLLLHQFFLDRIQSLVQCKHLHLLRWRRFCEHTAAIERLYPDYCKRLEAIDSEYKDAKQRAFRLASAHTSYINKDSKALGSVQSEDVAIYVRWLVTNLHCVKKFASFLRVLQWIPVIHRNSIDPTIGTHIKPSGDVEVVEEVGFEAKASWQTFTGSDYSASATSAQSLGHSRPTPSASLDHAFTGFVSDELTLGVPPHMIELSDFRDHLEALASEYGVPIRTELASSSDEMELFGAVNRRFKRLFNMQEECKTFYQYDCVPEGNEHWGVDSPIHCLIKPCNWTSYISIVPHRNALQERQLKRLKQAASMDELLASQSRFLEVTDFSLVTESLKRHAYAVQDPPTARALQVTTHRKGELRSTNLWLEIYNNADLYQDSGGNGDAGGDGDAGGGYTGSSPRTGRKESYDYSNTMQMLGLDDGEDTASNDPTVVQGAYLSFLHLRHLKMRDTRRQCMAILNYFRSVERTITIYNGGLSLEEAPKEEEEDGTKSQKGKGRGKRSNRHRKHASTKSQSNRSLGGRGKTRGLGSHHYMNSTPADYKIEEGEFMEFGGIANHDDFYQLEEEGAADENDTDNETRSHVTASVRRGHYVPHVQDQRGYYIIYESALKDLKTLEKTLLLVSSHYIEKDKKHRSCARRSATEMGGRKHDAAGEVDLSAYAHRDVDRFAVLLDAWTCELNFLDNKRKLLDCYLEAYHNTFDPKERRELAQAVTDVIHQRPRYDLKQDYFVHTYRMECSCLRLKTTLLKQILLTQIEENRQYFQSISRSSNNMFGMPLPVIYKQPVAVNLPKPALMHLHMFEFHPSLGATAGRLPEALRHALRELTQVNNTSSQIEIISIEKQILEVALHEWEGMTEPGTSYSSQVQKELFSDSYCGDPLLLKDVVESLLAGETTETDTRTPAEKQKRAVEVWKICLEALVLRHRLQESAWETEILSRIYKHVASEMGFEEFHMYLRLAQFEFASPKAKADPHPSTLTRFIVDDNAADRFVPNHLMLAVHELDENTLPKFSFADKTAIMKILMEPNTLDNIRMSVACQLVHKNALIVAVSQAVTCMSWKDPRPATSSDGKKGSTQEASETRSSHSVSSSHTQGTARSGAISPSGSRSHLASQRYSSKLSFGFEKQKKSQEPFISLQLEKVGPRDVVVNAFIHKKETAGMMLRKPGEIGKLKRQLVTDFCKEFSFRMGLHAMRAQIIACYSSILSLLEDFPTTRDNYFMVGRANEKKRKLDDVEGMVSDPRTLRQRPRRVLSSDGGSLINLWFIPHYTEVIFCFRNKDYETQHQILGCWLGMISSLHDIMQCLRAHSRLGSGRQTLVENTGFAVAADWGGMEGVGAELIEIQKQIDCLGMGLTPPGKDPFEVAEFLKLRRDVMYLEFDSAVRHFIRKSFLEAENKSAYRAVTQGMHFALPALSDSLFPSLFQFYFEVPEPLSASEEDAEKLFPWLSFESSHGAFPVMYRMQWRDVENCMQLCLSSLDDIERQKANGEILGTSILYQDVLVAGTFQLKSLHETSEKPVKGFIAANPIGKSTGDSRPVSAMVQRRKSKDEDANAESVDAGESEEEKESRCPLSKLEKPIASYRLVKTFFLLCKQLDILKNDWAAKKLRVEKIDSPPLLHDMKRIYASEVYLPVLQTIARDMGMMDYYDDVISDEQMVAPPPGAPEITVRARQVRKLLEVLECDMLKDVRRRVAVEMSLVLAERSREETALPTDLWKKQSIRETFTVNKPNIVEDFLDGLMGDYSEEKGNITFSSEHLNSCVARLAGAVTKRERENYEMYSMFYENILRHHHHLLYQKELEIRSMKSKSEGGLGGGSQIQAQFQLADRSHELILEITALRAKIAEMRDEKMRQEPIIRRQVQKDYQELVERLFEECFQIKGKLNQYHMSLHENVRVLISETRRESIEMLGKLRNKSLNSAAEERLRMLQAKDDQLKEVHQEKGVLNILLSKLHALNHWKRSSSDAQSKMKIEKLSQELARCKRDLQSLQFLSAQNKTLLEEQLQGARKALEVADMRLKQVHQQLEKQRREQKEREYKELQEAKNRQQLADAQKKNFNRMLVELDEKDKRLRSVTAESEKIAKLNHVNNTKVERKMNQMRKELVVDRTLKLDAFDKVDDLQATILDYEHSYYASAPSYSQQYSRATSATTYRARSAMPPRSVSRPPPSIVSISSPPYTPRTTTRPLSSMPAYAASVASETTIPHMLTRPKTASGRLKSKIAAALLSEMDPPLDSHDTIVQLREIS